MTAASDEALEALEAEALEAEMASDAILAEQDAQLEQLKRQLADAQARKAAMASQASGAPESESQGDAGGGESMTPRNASSNGDSGVQAVPSAVLHSRPPATWSTDELCSWLDGTMNLGGISAAAKEEEVDGPTAVEMDNDAWKELGATALKAAKIVASLKKLG
jgi:hypothetical protein